MFAYLPTGQSRLWHPDGSVRFLMLTDGRCRLKVRPITKGPSTAFGCSLLNQSAEPRNLVAPVGPLVRPVVCAQR